MSVKHSLTTTVGDSRVSSALLFILVFTIALSVYHFPRSEMRREIVLLRLRFGAIVIAKWASAKSAGAIKAWLNSRAQTEAPKRTLPGTMNISLLFE